MAVDLLGLGVNLLRCLAGSAMGFMVSKGVRSAASESSGSIRNFLQKDIDHIREKLDSMAQSKLSAALQNVRQGLMLLDQQYSIATPTLCSSGGSELEGAMSLCVTTRTVLSAENPLEISADVRYQFEVAQQLAVEAFHDKRNVPAMLRVECLKLQLFCTMLIYHHTPERWLGLWSVILDELAKDKELAAAAASACESGCQSTSSTTKSALSIFWRKPNTDLSQAMGHLVDSLHCALIAALWHPNVDARLAFGRSRILQYPRLLLCYAQNQSQHPSGSNTVNLEAPFLYPWRSDRIVVVLPSVFKVLSLYPTNKILTAQVRNTQSGHSNQSAAAAFSLHILDILTLTEDESLQLDNGTRLLDLDFDRKSLNIMLLCSATLDGRSIISYNLQFEKNFKISVSLTELCSQIVCDPVTGAVIAFEGKSADNRVYVLKQSDSPADDTNRDWVSYENIFKCMLADRPGHVRVAYAKQFRQTFGDDGDSCEKGLELMLYNRFTDVAYSLVSSIGENDSGSPASAGIIDSTISSTTSTLSTEEDSLAKIQPIYPLKSSLLKVRVTDSGNLEDGSQKVMLEEGGIFDNDQLVWAKEKCLASMATLDEAPAPQQKPQQPALVGAFISNDDASTLNVFEMANKNDAAVGMRLKTGHEVQLPLLCEQWEDQYLGGIVWLGKFIFIGTLNCKVKISE